MSWYRVTKRGGRTIDVREISDGEAAFDIGLPYVGLLIVLLILPFWLLWKLAGGIARLLGEPWGPGSVLAVTALPLVGISALLLVAHAPDAFQSLPLNDRLDVAFMFKYCVAFLSGSVVSIFLAWCVVQWKRRSSPFPGSWRVWLPIAGVALGSIGVFGLQQAQAVYAHTKAPYTALLTHNLGRRIDGIPCADAMASVYYYSWGPPLFYSTGGEINVYKAGRAAHLPTMGDSRSLNDKQPCRYWVMGGGNGYFQTFSPWTIHPTLGTLFDVGKQPLSRSRVATVAAGPGQAMRIFTWDKGNPDGAPHIVHGNPRDIPLKDNTAITIEIGPPFPTCKQLVGPPFMARCRQLRQRGDI